MIDESNSENTGLNSDVTEPLLQIRGLTKHFGGVQALKGVDLDIRPGEVHGLVGANGAGKSTLIKILSGVIGKDSGELFLDGEKIQIHDAQHSYKLGFSFIHQELNLIPKFSIIENMTLGLPKPSRFGLIDWKAIKGDARKAADTIGLDFPLDTPLEELSVAEQWLVSIARAIIQKSRLISMDEPTASLSAEESERLFKVIGELSSKGIAILYVSHRLDEIMRLCDGISVFKDGSCVLTTEKRETTKQALVKAIVGGEINQVEFPVSEKRDSPVILETRNISRGDVVKDVSVAVHKGEVLGFGGLVGSGRTEFVRLLFGADRPDSGEIIYGGESWIPKSPFDAMKRGIGLVPEERRSQGLIIDKSVHFNMNIVNLKNIRFFSLLPFLNFRKAKNIAKDISERLKIKTASVDTRVGDLSGGNQQKVVIGKWLTRNLKLLILDEPSRGVDVGARSEIHKRIRELAAEGVSVIVISSDTEELPGLCDRVVVMAEGRVVGTLSGHEITKEAILHISYEHMGKEHMGQHSETGIKQN